MSRWLSAPLLIAVGGLLGLGLVAGPRAEAQPGCRLAKGDSLIGKACQDGGLLGAKQMMRKLVREAKAAGTAFECSDCHPVDASFDRLSPDARDKFNRLLAAARRR